MIIEKSRKARDILVWIKNSTLRVPYITLISRELKITYGHLSKIVKHLEKERLVKADMVGRRKSLKLTVKGGKVAEKLLELKELLNG